MPLKGIHCPPILSLRVYAERRASFATRHRTAVLAVAAKILELAQDERVVARDQAFTARLLKIANSPYYGQSRAVTTVSQVVPVSVGYRLDFFPRARAGVLQLHRPGPQLDSDPASALGALHGMRRVESPNRPPHRSSRRGGNLHRRLASRHRQGVVL